MPPRLPLSPACPLLLHLPKPLAPSLSPSSPKRHPRHPTQTHFPPFQPHLQPATHPPNLTHPNPTQKVEDVPAGSLKWQLTWDQMLTAELAYHRQARLGARCLWCWRGVGDRCALPHAYAHTRTHTHTHTHTHSRQTPHASARTRQKAPHCGKQSLHPHSTHTPGPPRAPRRRHHPPQVPRRQRHAGLRRALPVLHAPGAGASRGLPGLLGANGLVFGGLPLGGYEKARQGARGGAPKF
jgi:hypothetical protein